MNLCDVVIKLVPQAAEWFPRGDFGCVKPLPVALWVKLYLLPLNMDLIGKGISRTILAPSTRENRDNSQKRVS